MSWPMEELHLMELPGVPDHAMDAPAVVEQYGALFIHSGCIRWFLNGAAGCLDEFAVMF